MLHDAVPFIQSRLLLCAFKAGQDTSQHQLHIWRRAESGLVAAVAPHACIWWSCTPAMSELPALRRNMHASATPSDEALTAGAPSKHCHLAATTAPLCPACQRTAGLEPLKAPLHAASCGSKWDALQTREGRLSQSCFRAHTDSAACQLDRDSPSALPCRPEAGRPQAAGGAP